MNKELAGYIEASIRLGKLHVVGQGSGGTKKLRQRNGNRIIQIGVSYSRSGDGAAAVAAVGTEAAIVQQSTTSPRA